MPLDSGKECLHVTKLSIIRQSSNILARDHPVTGSRYTQESVLLLTKFSTIDSTKFSLISTY